ncbi:MAG TPA: acyltransferase, partial [Candidatus Dormibacteraeota bacterium]|nr:acyltransferase [Candidatus Dormibacteraeota bacterium]
VAAAIAAVWLQGRPNVDHFPLASSGSVLVAYLPMISPYHYDTIDSPVWSLVHEMRFSLVFPLLVFAVTRLGRPRVTLALTFVIAIPALGALRFMPFGNNLPPPLNSLAYLPAFTAGILLAQNRQRLAAWYLSNGGAARLAFGAICLAIFAWPIPLYELWHPFLVLPCTALVLIALVEVCVSRLLTSRPAQFAGRISYSLYLSHTPILFVGMLTIGRILPGIAVVGLSWLVVVPLSTALYRWIELPIIAAGRRLTQAATST